MGRFKTKFKLVNPTEARSLLKILKDLNLVNELNIHSLFHYLPENAVVHEFVKIFFKLLAGVLPPALIKIDVGVKPRALLKKKNIR